MKPSRKGKSKTPLSRDQMSMDTDRLLKHIESLNLGSIEEINKYMQENISGKKIDDVLAKFEDPQKEKSAREQADDIMYQAYGADFQQALQLTKKALSIDPENIRALTFQAEHETGTKALELYKKAEHLGKKQLGDKFFEEEKGHFWNLGATRPYMKAKLGMADWYFQLGDEHQAIKLYNEILELNKHDNMGVRFRLSSILLKNKMLTEFKQLYDVFEDDGSNHLKFNYALFLFATQGNQIASRNALSIANDRNKHVIPMLIGKDHSYRFNTTFREYALRSKEEAIIYLEDSIEAWQNYSGAVPWVKGLYK